MAMSLRKRKRARKLLIRCAIIVCLLVALFVYGKVTGFDWAACLRAAGDFVTGLPQRLSQLSFVSELGSAFSQMSVLQWILAVVFFGIFLYFIRGIKSADLRIASIIWGISAIFYGVAFILLFSPLDLMQSGLFLILVAIAELLALINVMAIAGLGFFGGIFCTYLQIIVLLPVGAILLGNADSALERGRVDEYQGWVWLFQLVVLLVILIYQALVFWPGSFSKDSDDPVQTMIGTEIELSDWVDDF